MENLDPEKVPPLPTTLEEAHKEIRYLQRCLFNERLRAMGKLERAENDRKALLGELKALKGKG